MSGIYYTSVTIPNNPIDENFKRVVHYEIVRSTVERISTEIEKLMTIQREEMLNIDSVKYQTEIAILSVDEYKELITIKRQYRRLQERMSFLVEESEEE